MIFEIKHINQKLNVYNIRFLIFIFIFSLLSVQNLLAQKGTKSTAESFISSINDKQCITMHVKEADVIKLKRAARNALLKYYNVATLLDNNGMVTRESTQKFKEVFEEDAKILSDISQNVYYLNAEDYASMAFEFMTNTGVIFSLSNPVLNKIYEQDGYYFSDIILTKTIHNYLNNKMVYQKCKKGRQFKVTITFRSTVYDLENALIQNIKGGLIRECNDSNPAWGWNIEGGNISFQTEKGGQLEPFPTIQPKLSNGFYAKLGAYYYKSIGTSEKLWLKMGLQAGLVQTATKIDSTQFTILNTKDAFGTNSIKYDRFDRTTTIESEFSELLSLAQLTIPIGLKYDLYQSKSKKIGFGVEFGANVSINFNIKKSWNGRLSTKGTYVIGENIYTIPTNNADIDNSAYGLKSNIYFDDAIKSPLSKGTKVVIPSHQNIKINPTIAANITPYFYWSISDKSMLQVGIPISYSFTNFFKPSNTTKICFNGEPIKDGSMQDRIDQGLASSMAEDLFKSTKFLSFGLQVGIFSLIK